MKFKVLKAKKNIVWEIIKGFGGIETVIIAMIAICNIFVFTKTAESLIYQIGVSIMSMILWYKIKKDIWEDLTMNSNGLYMTIVAMIMFSLSFIYCKDAYNVEVYIIKSYVGLFLIGMIIEYSIILLSSAVFGLFLLIKTVLSCIYENGVKHVIIARFPESKEELIECGVHNRIECAIYYLIMQKGFKTNRSRELFNLSELNAEMFDKLVSILYSFEISESEYKKLKDKVMQLEKLSEAASVLLDDLIPEKACNTKNPTYTINDFRNHLIQILKNNTYGACSTEDILITLNEIME